MRINVAVPEPEVSAPILNAALEGVTRLDQALIRKGTVPTFREMAHRVRWKPEPPGAEHFDHAGVVGRRGWGDCDDLAPWHAASLRVTGEDRGARAVVRKSGPKRWHVVVRRSDGSVDDPSIEAGMPAPGRRVGIRGAVQPPMASRAHGVDGTYVSTPHLAIRPVPSAIRAEPEAWQSRTDLPWHWQPGKSPADVAMVSLHRSPYSSQALVGGCHGAILLGESSGYSSSDDLDRIAAIRDMCEGASYEEIADEYGPEHAAAASHLVGSFFGKIFKGAKKIFHEVKHNPLKAVKYTPTGLIARSAHAGVTRGPGAALAFTPAGLVVKHVPTPVVSKALQFIPGVGPVASQAYEAAAPSLRKLIDQGKHLPPKQRPAYHHALRHVPKIAPHRHMVFTGPPVPL
jgi:hypothetical protein